MRSLFTLAVISLIYIGSISSFATSVAQANEPVTTTVYTVLDAPQTFQRKPVYHTVTLNQIPWSSGTMVLSGSPDGKEPADIGEKIRIENQANPTTRRFIYDASYAEKPLVPLDITYLMNGFPNQGSPTSLRISFLSQYAGSIEIGPLYLVHIDDSLAKPSPFLILPWMYEAKNMSFVQAAMSAQVLFDHSFPLGFEETGEDTESQNQLTTFLGDVQDSLYSGYPGYVWGREAGISAGTDVRAASAGSAYTQVNPMCGVEILITHGNGFQSRYCQVDPIASIALATSEGEAITVEKGDIIGTVSSSPYMTTQPALYFRVLRDINNDGLFEDNRVNGAVDPFGWHSKAKDPWSLDNSLTVHPQATGVTSWYLWEDFLPNTRLSVPSSLGFPTFSIGESTFRFSTGIHNQDSILKIAALPKRSIEVDGEILHPLSLVYQVILDDGFGNHITQFRPGKYMIPEISFSGSSLSQFVLPTVGMYSSSDNGLTWVFEESSSIDPSNKMTAQVNHLTDFAVFGKKIDSTPPVTTLLIGDTTPTSSYIASSLAVSFTVDDTGTSSTLYRTNNSLWQRYYHQFNIESAGTYFIEFFSEDDSGNIEDVQRFETQLVVATQTPTPTLIPTLTPIKAQTPTPTQTYTPTATPVQTQNITPSSTPTPLVRTVATATASRNSETKAVPTVSVFRDTTPDESDTPDVSGEVLGTQAEPRDNQFTQYFWWLIVLLIVAAIFVVCIIRWILARSSPDRENNKRTENRGSF